MSVEDVAESRPPFARDFPKDDELDALVAAFARGDFRRVRNEAPKLAARTSDDAVRCAALELRARIDPSPVALYLVALGVLLLVILVRHYLAHPGG